MSASRFDSNMAIDRWRRERLWFCVLVLLSLAAGPCANIAFAQSQPNVPGAPGATTTAKAGASIDLTGYWVSIIDDEWRWRMVTPAKGDFSFVPLNAEGRRVAGAWDPAKDQADGNECKAYGAAGLMRLPERVHITWADDNTLKLETDAGMQKRLFHFGGSKWKGGEPGWQGDSVASWEKQNESQGFGVPVRQTSGEKIGSLKIVTTHMKAGYLRKNGVPYSENAVLTEYFDRFELDGEPYMVVTGIVEDRQYLTGQFITTEQFKQERDNSKWDPQPCKIVPPLAPPVRPAPPRGF